MNAPVYLLDTQVVVHFAKGHIERIGRQSLAALLRSDARVVVPSYALEEVQQRFGPKMKPTTDILIPPTALLRLLTKCLNVRVLDRGPAVLSYEFQLSRNGRGNGIPRQDIPIAAAVLTAQRYYSGPVHLVTNDLLLKKWARAVGVLILGEDRVVHRTPKMLAKSASALN